MAVPARISIVTLGVADLDRSIAFYEALGWERASSSVDGEISWFRTADTYLGLFGHDALAADAELPAGERGPFGGVTLAICLENEAACDDAMDAAVRAGGTVLKRPQRAEWGGYSGYFADPDGHPWEVAHNPNFPIGDDGRVTIP
ncbi:MAG TPA: VOC family protein [Actinomycetota bacterium]|nr:VOC family protein [Actinomycetota bacterium]